MDVLDHDACQKLAKWFEDRWNDRWGIDISNELVQIIEESQVSEKLLIDKISDAFGRQQKRNYLTNLLQEMRRKQIIRPVRGKWAKGHSGNCTKCPEKDQIIHKLYNSIDENFKLNF